MDKTFQKLLQTDIDLSSLGVERRTDNEPYFCTPKGASVFGWTGVDGIHFCFVRGFGGMVFAVSPANTFPNYVHPLAKNFADFLRLLLACGDVAALEQAWMWDKAQFETFLQDNPPTQEQQETLALVATKLKLMPMERPWAYIKELQASFDYSKIKYTKEYYPSSRSWWNRHGFHQSCESCRCRKGYARTTWFCRRQCERKYRYCGNAQGEPCD